MLSILFGILIVLFSGGFIALLFSPLILGFNILMAICDVIAEFLMIILAVIAKGVFKGLGKLIKGIFITLARLINNLTNIITGSYIACRAPQAKRIKVKVSKEFTEDGLEIID